jgi:hypothetical protein
MRVVGCSVGSRVDWVVEVGAGRGVFVESDGVEEGSLVGGESVGGAGAGGSPAQAITVESMRPTINSRFITHYPLFVCEGLDKYDNIRYYFSSEVPKK